MAIKEKDFVEVEYVGTIKEEGVVFDATDEKVAKDNEIYNPDMTYGPVTICVGEGHLIEGLDKFLIGKEPGEYKADIPPEEGFGKKNPKMLRLMPTSVFTKQSVTPMPGLQVTLDGAVGTIRSVTGGRTLVDFNHPLSGRVLEYEIKVNKIIDDDKEKVYALMRLQFGTKDLEVEVNDGKAVVKTNMDVTKEINEVLTKKIKELIPSIKDVSFKKIGSKEEKAGGEKKEEAKAEKAPEEAGAEEPAKEEAGPEEKE